MALARRCLYLSLLFCLQWTISVQEPSQAGVPDMMSVVLDGNTLQTQQSVRVINPPEVISQDMPLTVEFHCPTSHQVGLEVRISTLTQADVMVFRDTWPCQSDSQVFYKKSNINLPKNIRYRPSHNHKRSIYAEKCFINAWIIEKDTLAKLKHYKLPYEFAPVKVSYPSTLLPPYERSLRPETLCHDWWRELQLRTPYSPQCAQEPEVYQLISFPVALSGSNHGVQKSLPPYKHKWLRFQHATSHAKARFTISIWLYILEYPMYGLSSIVQRLTWDDRYMTPLIYMNNQGRLHIQVVADTGTPIAYLTPFSMPKDQWCHLVASYADNLWHIKVRYGEKMEKVKSTIIRISPEVVVWTNDTIHLYVIGGTEINPSFRGYVGQATIYRRRALSQDNNSGMMKPPDPYHPMFQLGIGQKKSRCHTFINWVKARIYQCKVMRENIMRKKTCAGSFWDVVVGRPRHPPIDLTSQCNIYQRHRAKQYRNVMVWVKQQILLGRVFSIADVGRFLYENASEVLEERGLEGIREVIHLLKQASCYDNHDASYLLSVIYNHGVAVKSNEILAHSYLLQGALDNHRLSLLALGNKHVFGLDGVPVDYSQAYAYYKNVADTSSQDRQAHYNDDVYTEHIRLTDETNVQLQTEEDGDLYMWFKLQAGQGVVHAQRNMARMLFWGAQGIKRNIAAAVEYYRLGAESGDPAALYDYGILLLRGQGVEKNYTAALEYLGQAAEKGNAGAMNALGWHAMEIERNYTKALLYFQRAYNLSNPDAAHNLGHMLMSGKWPGKGIDKIEAVKYFSAGALRGQIDSSLMVALYNIRGHPKMPRNPAIAIQWSRYVAELNPALGKVLVKGLRAYREAKWPQAVLYYMLAADAGLEVGNFNLAYLCEENNDFMNSYIEKDCIWRYYNLSTFREPQQVDPYSWIKMGDYYWYGCGGEKDARKAAFNYANAAYRGDTHALFNLGMLVEEGIDVPRVIWNNLKIPKQATHNNVTLLTEIYNKCKESVNAEAYVPCSLALIRIQLIDVWTKYHILVKFSSVLGSMAVSAVTATSIYSYFHRRRLPVNTV